MPKQKKLWVFGAWFGQKYSDNSKAFFEYVNENHHDIHPIWIASDIKIIELVRSKGYTAYLAKSCQGIYYQLRAEFAFVCQSLHEDLYPAAIGKRTKVVNLWHGLPLKKIMYDVFGANKKDKNLVGRIFDALSPYDNIRNDYLLATSAETQKTLAQAFRLTKEQTIITGFPRNDVLLTPENKAPEQAFTCIYMPTFRGGIGSECDLFTQFGFDVELFDQKLVQHNVKLVLRMHPVNKPPAYLQQQIALSKNISIDSTDDIFDSLASYDCMVTDYSGGYFDFLLTGRPILFAPFDLEKYKQQERDLYYQYEDVTLQPYSYAWPELIDQIIAVKSGSLPDGYQEAYKVLQSRFHSPNEGNISFSERLFKFLQSI